ncbi:MAG: undecaprenyl-diphosphate phosphatase [Acidobacteriota bacterium]|nr:undecaprenyl-diphosphate phosphatase [Acidobacteriota bacterium]
MPLYQAIVLAIVQGLTEFLPVSSTAHLWIIPWILKWNDPGLTFDVALHAGTLAAVLLFFWRYWLEMIKMVLGISGGGAPAKAGSVALLGENRQLFWFLVIATIPGGIAGWLFERAADEKLRSPFIIGTALIVVGLVMWAGERVRGESHNLGQVGLLDSIIVGVAQAFAVIPGVSRSGSTMTAGLFRGMNRETAARFSFLLSTPLIAGACLKKGWEIHHAGMPADMRMPFLLGIIVSAVMGYAVIAMLIRYLERRTFAVFVVYRVILGVILLAVGWGLRH